MSATEPVPLCQATQGKTTQDLEQAIIRHDTGPILFHHDCSMIYCTHDYVWVDVSSDQTLNAMPYNTHLRKMATPQIQIQITLLTE
jgi:hypothetical protein